MSEAKKLLVDVLSTVVLPKLKGLNEKNAKKMDKRVRANATIIHTTELSQRNKQKLHEKEINKRILKSTASPCWLQLCFLFCFY